ncbi:hypothetical protein NQ317_000789 [Molorchus minor]|uniref:Uncharacterized protein n=1 Tax=Molorchus minor TaxID=1323400 RepID=A0ABQ9J4F5_9CUCU|nr:hypothetical protein NQ317_000789 [Molorchus minor]
MIEVRVLSDVTGDGRSSKKSRKLLHISGGLATLTIGGVNHIWRHNFEVTDWLIHSLIYTNVCRKHLVAGFVN